MVISAHCLFICLLAKVTHPQPKQPDPSFRKLANTKKFLLIFPPPPFFKLHHKSRFKDTTRTFSKAQLALNFRIFFQKLHVAAVSLSWGKLQKRGCHCLYFQPLVCSF